MHFTQWCVVPFVLLSLSPLLSAQVVINEVMYDPDLPEPEWIELHNSGSVPIDVSGWTVQDRTSAKPSIPTGTIPAKGYLLLTKDSAALRGVRSPGPQIVQLSLPALNNGGDDLVLRDADENTVDSVSYASSWGGKDGVSLERVDPTSVSNDSDSWGSSVDSTGATPGRRNSIAPAERDLAVHSLQFNPDTREVTVIVMNSGAKTSVAGTLVLYHDANNDTLGTPDEVQSGRQIAPLGSGDSVEIILRWNRSLTVDGEIGLVVVDHPGEERPENNYARFIVRQKFVDTGVVINEIMYDPDSPEPEWVELYNRGTLPTNLQGWVLHDASRGRPELPDHTLLPGMYVVITSDTQSLRSLRTVPSDLLEMELPAFNNSGDAVVLRNLSGHVVDSLQYAKSWGGDEGRSLERKLPVLPSDQEESWETSRDPSGATPGLENSTRPPERDLALKSLLFNSEQISLSAVVLNAGRITPAGAEAVLYHDADDNDIPDPYEELERQALSPIPPNDSASIYFDWNRPLQLEGERAIVLLMLDGEERPDDNVMSILIRQPTVDTGLIVNEIMYDPDDPEPEWIELYNRGELPVNIEDWRIEDATGKSPPLPSSIVLPGGYIIVTPDTTELLRKRTVSSSFLQSPLPVFNNSGDNVVVHNAAGVTVDSVQYRSSWGGRGGRSLERKEVNLPSTNSTSWTSTTDLSGGTPGRKNSYMPILNDLALTSVTFHPHTSSAKGYVKNQGLNRSATSQLQLYVDLNGNGEPESEEELEEKGIPPLDPADTLEVSFDWPRPLTFSGEVGLMHVSLTGDQRPENNLAQFLAISPTVDTGLIINEIMYDPDDPEPEWIELYNRGELPVDLDGWTLHDAGRTRPVLFSYKLRPNQYVVLTSDSSLLRSLRSIPSEIIEVDLPALNNGGDDIVLRNSSGIAIDSLHYLPAWGGDSGRSLERKLAELPSSEGKSWATSIDQTGATPGRENATQPPDLNLKLQSLLFNPEDSFVRISLLNTGLQTSNEAEAILYYDSNQNGTGERFEEESRVAVPAIKRDDSAIAKLPWKRPLIPEGEEGVVEIVMPGDSRSDDNRKRFVARPWLSSTGIVINELMYAPGTSEPEWLELYNSDSLAADLTGWSISDASGRIMLDTGIIKPGEYILITSDGETLRSVRMIDPEISILPADLPTFNNGEDEVVLRNSSKQVVDSLHYFSSWGGRGGVSLERRYFDDPTNDSAFWSSSIDESGGTPGRANSILPYVHNLRIDSVRFSPVTSEITVQLVNNGIEGMGQGEIILFYDANQNRKGDAKEELFRTGTPGLLPNEVAVLNIPWQRMLVDEGEDGLILLSLREDEHEEDNIAHLFIRREPLDSGLVFSEIMFDPIALNGVAGAEYVEVYNMMDRPIPLGGWRIVEGSGTEREIPDGSPLLLPGFYGLIASDSAIYLRYPYLQDSSNVVILGEDLGLNNSSDELILLNPKGQTIDRVGYTNEWHWDELVDTRGVSLERIALDGRSNDRRNWSSSVGQDGGTPGARNSRSLPVTTGSAELAVQPRTISPDGDGFEDFVRVTYRLPANTSRTVVEIFDRHGRRVARPINNQPSAAEGGFLWDGRDEDGNILPIGIYVLRIESYDREGAGLRSAQTTIVVARRL